MNHIKRLFVSIGAQVNRIADDFENHEAVAGAAIQEFATLYATATAHARQQETELRDIDRRIETLQNEEQLWARRAVESEAQDRARAIECVRRLQCTRRALAQATQSRHEAAAVLAEISGRCEEMRQQLESLKQRRQQLGARQCQSDAQRCVGIANPDAASAVGAVLQRWDSRLTAAEALRPSAAPVDTFAYEFSRAEEETELQATLTALLAAAGKQDPNSST